MKAAALIAGLALLTVAGSAATQTAAPPPPIFVELARMCIGANGDAAVTAARATEAGYSPTPQNLFPSRRVRDAAGFMKSDETALRLVVTAMDTKRFGGEDVDMRLCAVAMQPADARNLPRDVQTALGQRPLEGAQGIFGWLQDAQGRRPITNASARQFSELLRTGNTRFIGIERRGDMAMLVYMVPQID